jgi:hypothetical protein
MESYQHEDNGIIDSYTSMLTYDIHGSDLFDWILISSLIPL